MEQPNKSIPYIPGMNLDLVGRAQLSFKAWQDSCFGVVLVELAGNLSLGVSEKLIMGKCLTRDIPLQII